MPSTFNLIRNSKVLFSTNVDTQGVFQQGTACTAANTYQITVLDGFSFSQSTNSDTVSISEAGGQAVRGTRSFNTSLNPAEFTFATYIRPYVSSGLVKSEDSVLWNALLGDTAITAAPVTGLAYTTLTSAVVDASGVLNITGTGLTGNASLAVGKVYNITGVVGANANRYNSPVKVLSITSTTGLSLQYLTAPPAATITAQLGATGVTKFTEVAWNEYPAIVADTSVPVAYSEVSTARSNLNQLQKFALVVTVDQVTYALDNCVLDQATIDFGLEGIAQVSWTGRAAGIRQLSSNVSYGTPTGSTPGGSGGTLTITGGATGTVTASSLSTKYITNKLSTVALAAQIGGGGKVYNLALTGGSVTIANNVNYITPANLGVVNQPIGYYTGNRAITGNITAYLRTGSNNTADLFADMVQSAATNAETKFNLNIVVGGVSNPVKVELTGVGAALQIPTIDAQAVMSTTINFSLQGTDNVVGTATASYDLENTNDLRVRYFSN